MTFCSENPKQKAWFEKTDIKDLFSFNEDDKEEENAFVRDSMAATSGNPSSWGSTTTTTTTSAGLPCAGVVNLFKSADDVATDQVNPHQHLDVDVDVNDGDRIMVEKGTQ